ncbi:hypothetical protein BCR37DRAFT_332475, partial [Protomyces lactucae-debilis]
FTLKAHLTIVTGDMPAIAKMMQFKGANGRSPCRLCRIQADQTAASRHMYFPLKERQFVKARFATIDHSRQIALRRDVRKEIDLVNSARDDQTEKDHGIKGRSVFLALPTVHFSDSFGLDVMHLFSNQARHMWSLWLKSELLSRSDAEQIGREMANAGSSVPVAVARKPRDISAHFRSFKASQWYDFILIWSPILLNGRLPQFLLDGWLVFVEAVRRSLKVRLQQSQIDEIEELFRQYVEHVEVEYL